MKRQLIDLAAFLFSVSPVFYVLHKTSPTWSVAATLVFLVTANYANGYAHGKRRA